MIKLPAYARAHPVPVSLVVLVCASLAVAIWFAVHSALMLRETSFLVAGDTTAFTFHAAPQDEGEDQAGIFASSDRTVDLQVSCTAVRQTISMSNTVACPDGTLSFEHISVAKIRLNDDTRVDLDVADGNLRMTLTAKLGGHPLVTLFSDEKTTIRYPRKPLPYGEWTIDVAGPAVRLTFIDPRLDPNEDEGGESLTDQSIVAFERQGASGFQATTGKLSLAEGPKREIVDLTDSRIQVLAITQGKVLSLRPVVSPQGRLQSLRVQLRGQSKMINLIDVVTGATQNHSFSFADRYTGKTHVAAGLVGLIFAAGGFLSSLAVCYEFWDKLKNPQKSKSEQTT